MTQTFLCSQCCQRYPTNDCTKFNGKNYCPDCLRELTSVCAICGARIPADDAYLYMGRTLCVSCFRQRTGH